MVSFVMCILPQSKKIFLSRGRGQYVPLTYFPLVLVEVTEDKIPKTDHVICKTVKPEVCAQYTPGHWHLIGRAGQLWKEL